MQHGSTPNDPDLVSRRRLAWSLTLIVFLPFALATMLTLRADVALPPASTPGMEQLAAGELPPPKIMRKMDEAAMPALRWYRLAARVIATVGGVLLVSFAARRHALYRGEPQPLIRVAAAQLLEVTLVAFGFFFVGMAGLIVFTMTQAPAGNPAGELERIVYHIHGNMIYYAVFQFAEIVVFCAGLYGLLAYRLSGFSRSRTLAVVLAVSAVLLAFNKSAYFILPVVGYVWETLKIAKR